MGTRTTKPAEGYLARSILDRRRRVAQAQKTASQPVAGLADASVDVDDLKPLIRHALKLWIFIGWALVILSAAGALIGFFTALA